MCIEEIKNNQKSMSSRTDLNPYLRKSFGFFGAVIIFAVIGGILIGFTPKEVVLASDAQTEAECDAVQVEPGHCPLWVNNKCQLGNVTSDGGCMVNNLRGGFLGGAILCWLLTGIFGLLFFIYLILSFVRGVSIAATAY